MKRKLPLLFLAVLSLLVACDHIGENERYIKVETATPAADPGTPSDDTPAYTTKRVLLEDFTGQRCVNCPTGTEVIEQLQAVYGDQLIAVGIHGGPLGFKGSAKATGLATDLGDEYYNHWQLEYQPVGLIDRGPATDYTAWGKAVSDAAALQSETRLEASATLSGSAVNITVTEERLGGSYAGRLQVWLIEDGIVALQMMPDGASNQSYVHNHVLRTAVNGTWGDDLTLSQGETKTQTLTQTVDATWNTAQLSVVAFVYNDRGVEQAVKAKVQTND